ncbi:hypothetical protein HG536_0F03220 [Torulaspora globosa]|uniref:Protein FMP52, mitochondrial n=1 Tax=Torulaspora globosa TaxID=48254 RepID=A0A7G3ZKG1_9SACH|nr:uncharacterized protein HG536_0F03220 [Torulaspora globosa]QLL33997.1 hypothetical protein HG536_0F03220 [Torulaspora globosa]
MSTLILGATGLCGRAFLKYCEKSPEFGEICTITRRPLAFESFATQKVDEDTTKWAGYIPNEHLKYVFTGLATTRGAAGGFDKQYKIDHDLNVELAKVAKKNGCSTFVLVSSAGAGENSLFPYLRMKKDIERDILALDFDHTIILRPSFLLGQRLGSKGWLQGFSAKIASFFYRGKLQMLAGYPVYGDEVGKVGAFLALKESAPGHSGNKVRIVESQEILRLAESMLK